MSQIDELRQIIVGGNSEQLAELQERLENLDRRTRDVAEVLSPAIDQGIKRDDALVNSLMEPVSLSLKQSVRNDPTEYAEILYPVMAPSIRRAIAQAISSLMVTINQTIGSATSADGLSLRFKSWRTGVPYAQLALRESLLYRVERLYLIDRDSGLLIREVGVDENAVLDSDAVSAMFSAIQSFVQDSFSQNDDDRLTDLKVGGYNVWVAHGRKLMLACVIDGDAPESLKNELYDALDNIRGSFASQIEAFDGDTEPFEGASSYIKPLLQSELKEDVDTRHNDATTNWGSLILFALIGLVVLYFAFQWFQRSTLQSTVEHYLKQTPGVAVTATYWENDKVVIEGLQDPDAELPASLLGAHGLEADDLDFRTIPFRSLETDMEIQRFNKELQLPAEVTFEVTEGEIKLVGEAPISWLLENDTRLRQLAADGRLNLEQLLASSDSVRSYARARFGSENMRLIDLLKATPWIDVPIASIVQPL